MTKQTTVSVLGTGIMGAAMARNLLKAGMAVRVYNRTPEKTRPLVEAGARAFRTPAEAVAGAEVVVTMVADGPAVEAVMVGEEGALAALGDGALWLQMSTVGEAWARRLAERAAQRGVAFVDAPVLGTREPAEQGALVVLAAGDEALQPRCRAVFDAVGKKTLWVGAAPRASRLKLVLNNWVVGLVNVLAESVALAEALDLDPALFLEAIEGGALDVPYAHVKGRAMMERRFPPSFPQRLALKDARLVVEAAAAHGLEALVSRAVVRRFEQGVALDHGDEDMAAVYFAARAGR